MLIYKMTERKHTKKESKHKEEKKEHEAHKKHWKRVEKDLEKLMHKVKEHHKK